MPNATWKAGNGAFFNASNWDIGIVPGAGTDVVVFGPQAGVTISYAGTTTLHSFTMFASTLNVAAGGLTLLTQSDLDGLSMTSGLIDFRNGGSFADNVIMKGGTLSVDSGQLTLLGGGTFAGTLSGAGTVSLAGGDTYVLSAGFTATTAGLRLGDSTQTTTLSLAASQTLSGLTAHDASTISLGTSTLTLKGINTFTSFGTVVGAGKSARLLTTGQLSTSLSQNFNGTMTWANTGTIRQGGGLYLGNGTGTISVANSGMWEIMTNDSIRSDGTARFTNSKIFEKISSTGTSEIDATFINTSTGTINATSGVLYFTAEDTFAGTITGSGLGTVAIGGGGLQTFAAGIAVNVPILNIIDNGTTLSLGSSLSFAGALNLGDSSAINLGGNTLSLSGTASLRGLVTGSGKLLMNSASAVLTSGDEIGGSVTLEVAGMASQNATVTMGDTPLSTAQLRLDAGAVYSFTNDSGIARNGTTTLANAGTLQKTGGLGTSEIDTALQNTGTVLANTGTILIVNTVTNDGTFSAKLGAKVAFMGAVTEDTGTVGVISVSQGATMSFAGYVDTGQTARFSDNTGIVDLTANDTFKGKIAGFSHGDLIDVLNFGTLTTKAFTAGVLTVSNSSHTVHLGFSGSQTLAGFGFASDGHGGMLISHV